jgi:hypothetical protein
MTTTNITAFLITGFTTTITVVIALPVLNSWLWTISYWLPAALAGPLALGLCIAAIGVLYAVVVRILKATEGA